MSALSVLDLHYYSNTWRLGATCRHGQLDSAFRSAWTLVSLAGHVPTGARRWRRHPPPRPACTADLNSWRTPEFNPPGSQEPGQAAPPSPGAPSQSRKGARKKKTFQQRYKELTLYYMEHGHSLVPVNCPSGLGGWVAYQRRLWKAGRLPLDHYHSLAALGFQFDAFDMRWAAQFRRLAEFHSRYGHCTVPADPASEAEWAGLRQWTLVQRQSWKRGLLDDDRVRRLSGLGFVWQPGEARWEERFAELRAFREEYGHCNVPKGWVHNQGLASWVERIRGLWRSRQGVRTISHSREARLRELGFEFEPQQRSWQERYEQLREVVAQEGHLAGPLPSKGKWGGLAEWVAHQRHRWQAGRLHPDRQHALEELGFVWDPEEAAWAAKLRDLDDLRARLGPQMARALLEGRPSARSAAATNSEPADSLRYVLPSEAVVAGGPAHAGRGMDSPRELHQSHTVTRAPRDSAAQGSGGGEVHTSWAGSLLENGGVGLQGRLRVGGGSAAGAVWEGAGEEELGEGGEAQAGALRTLRSTVALVRWWRSVKRQAAKGEVRREQLEQLALRGLGPDP